MHVLMASRIASNRCQAVVKSALPLSCRSGDCLTVADSMLAADVSQLADVPECRGWVRSHLFQGASMRVINRLKVVGGCGLCLVVLAAFPVRADVILHEDWSSGQGSWDVTFGT